MTKPQTSWAAALLAAASALVAAGCGTAAGDHSLDRIAPAAKPAAAVAATTKCTDGQPLAASFAPGGVTAGSKNSKTLQRIAVDHRLVVGVSADAELWGARNPVNGRFEGFDVDVAGAVAKALGVPVEYKVLALSQRQPKLQSGDVDLVAERMSITCARWQGTNVKLPAVNLSSAYYSAGVRLLVRRDERATTLAGLKNQPVCGVEGSSSLATLQGSGVTQVTAPEAGQCLVKFQEGEAVAIVGDDTTLAGLAEQDPYAKVVGARLNPSPYGLGMKAGDDDFTRFVNGVLADLRSNGTLADLSTKWKGKNAEGAPPPVPPAVYGRNSRALAQVTS